MGLPHLSTQCFGGGDQELSVLSTLSFTDIFVAVATDAESDTTLKLLYGYNTIIL